MPRFDISCQTTDETKPPIKVLEERSSQSDLHCVSETYIYMYVIFKNAKESRFNAGHIKVFIGENAILVVSFYVLYYCKYYLLIPWLN